MHLAHFCLGRNSGKLWICGGSPSLSNTEERLLSCGWTRRWESPHSTLQSSSALHSTTNFYSTAHLTGVPENGPSLWWCFLQSPSIKAWEANHTPPALLRLMWLKEKRGWKIAEEMKHRNIIYIFLILWRTFQLGSQLMQWGWIKKIVSLGVQSSMETVKY